MEKYDKVLDMIEHPDKYSADQLHSLLADPETREIYNILCKTDSAAEANKKIDVDAEWNRFAHSQGLNKTHGLFGWFGSRAASIALIICTSLAAVAAGIVVTVAVNEHRPDNVTDNRIEIVDSTISPDSASVVLPDTLHIATETIMFEDASLDSILSAIASAYNVEVKFNNKEAADLHLYYKLDPTLPLDEVISQLNTFEQINIIRKDNTLTID